MRTTSIEIWCLCDLERLDSALRMLACQEHERFGDADDAVGYGDEEFTP